ncbi:hypothetical protein PHMEG_0006690 [Phytophthora megakarya]|uniref:PiggyBac transposable element-derived protein domain-containing protein n=1 Tax=Phytophthora megakarya TaxID=4795 RepID=A0A225WN92_9STRA|nr:hypothetical protein PHMEG_0006690 [Phytophthora megakarya]
MDSLNMQSGLHIVAPVKLRKSYRDNAEYGRFSLFVTTAFRRSLFTWTSDALTAREQQNLTRSEFNTYVLVRKLILRRSSIHETVARTRSKNIRSALQFQAPGDPTLDKLHNPLWYSLTMLNHIQKQFAAFTVPTGISSIDEMTVATKACSKHTRACLPRHDKYGIMFYAVVGWDAVYVHTLWDNASGNTKQSIPAQRYTHLFPFHRASFYNTLRSNEVAVSPSLTTALWLTLVGHQAKLLRSPSGYRFTVPDKF